MTSVERILKDLVAFPVLGGQSNLSILEYIESGLLDAGIEYRLVPNETGNKKSLHCKIGPDADGGVILSGHMDVVPVEGQLWDTDPFVLTQKADGKLYGRGSCDMKGFLACCLDNMAFIKRQNLKKPIYFAFSYDEEIGCLSAPELAADINSYYTEKPKYAVIGEPSLLQPIVGQKGICVVKTEVNGSAGHSSRIKQEISAIHESARLITWLENKMNQLVSNNHLDERFHPPHSSLHIGIINGGIAPNVIADKCHFYWDIRVIPQDNISEIIEEFNAECRKVESKNQQIFPDFKIKNVLHHPAVPPLDTAETEDVVSFIKEISGREDLGTVAYAAEAGQFAEAGFQSVICGPGSIAQAHRANEFIANEQLEKGVEMIQRIAVKLAE